MGLKVCVAMVSGLAAAAGLSSEGVPGLRDVGQIAAEMQAASVHQQQTLCGYSVRRLYKVVNNHLSHSAEMNVEVSYKLGQAKRFRILSIRAQGVARRSLEDLLKEESTVEGPHNEKSMLALANYHLQLSGVEPCGPENCYKLQMQPRKRTKYLIEGTAWVSTRDYAFVRIVGRLAKSPSFWLSRPEIEQRFEKVDGFWLPSYNRSTTSILFFGEADLTIEYSSYAVQPCHPSGYTQAR